MKQIALIFRREKHIESSRTFAPVRYHSKAAAALKDVMFNVPGE